MPSVPSRRAAEIRSRQRSSAAIRDGLRKLRIQLSLLNYRVGSELELRDVDLDCLDIIDAFGPMSPSELARCAGLHPATTTGVLDRLERGGWAVRERDPDDRRSVLISSSRERYADLARQYTGMSRAMNKLIAGYSDEELAVIADFMEGTVEAARSSAEALAGE